MKSIASGLALVCLMTLQTGCARTRLITQTQTIKQFPPEVLMQPCDIPAFSGSTNADLVVYIERLIASLRMCNADKSALREWAQ
ncbi:Rz1-like lysis system protein LysC [Hahella sp. HN01]|uniref:Rz1-like lysis system protein LysC n=1 Tax=Hahella sp. HN01 TaxID=2847262 RepID=UPI003530540D